MIRKVVSEEFHRFLIYYKNSSSLNVPEHSEGYDDRGGNRNRRENDRNRSRNSYKNDDEDFDRLFINCGKIDELNPQRLMGIVNECSNGKRIQFGRIEILDKFSFFEIEKSKSKQILDKINRFEWRNRKLKVEPASARKRR